jgi:hypothetical protein
MNTTIENNKLLAEFMNYANGKPITDSLANNIGYQNDWNVLMGVVEKIRVFHNGTIPLNDKQIGELLILIKKLNEALTLRNGISIEAVYNACVEFVKWYSAQEKSKRIVQKY